MNVETLKLSENLQFVGDVRPAKGSKTFALQLYSQMTEGIPLQSTNVPTSLVIAGNSVNDAEEIIKQFAKQNPNSELQVKTDIAETKATLERRGLPSAQAIQEVEIFELAKKMLDEVTTKIIIPPEDAIIIIQALPEQSIERNTYSFQILRDSNDRNIYHIELRIGSATALARADQTPDLIYTYDASKDEFPDISTTIANENIRLRNFKYNLVQYGLKRLKHEGIEQLFGERLRAENLPLYQTISKEDNETIKLLEAYKSIKEATQSMTYSNMRITNLPQILDLLDVSTLFDILAEIGALELLRGDSLIDEHNIDKERAKLILEKGQSSIEPTSIPEEIIDEIRTLTRAVAKLPKPTCLKASICRIPKYDDIEYNPQHPERMKFRYDHRVLIWDLMELPTNVIEIDTCFVIDNKHYNFSGLPLRDNIGNILYCKVTNNEGKTFYLHKPSGILYSDITSIPSQDRNAVKTICGNIGD